MKNCERTSITRRETIENRRENDDQIMGFEAGRDDCLSQPSPVQIEGQLTDLSPLQSDLCKFKALDELEDEYHFNLGNDKPISVSDFFRADVAIRIIEENFHRRFLARSESEYAIETQPWGWKVARTPSNFAELETLLQRKLPFVFVPPFQPTEFGQLSKQTSSIEARRDYLQHFLNALLENPYTRNCTVLKVFLSSDLLEEELAQLRAEQPVKEQLTSALRDKNPNALNVFLKALPAFRQNAVVRTSHCSIQLTHALQTFLPNLTHLNRSILSAATEVKARASGLSKSLSCLARLVDERARLKDQLAREFELDYAPLMSIADSHTLRWLALLNTEVKRVQDCFSTTYFSALNYEKVRDESFAKYQTKMLELRALPALRGNGGESAAAEALQAYFTSMSNFSFKHMIVFKNRKECEALGQSVVQACGFASHLGAELTALEGQLRETQSSFLSNKEFTDTFVAMSVAG